MTNDLEKLVTDLTTWRKRTNNCGRIPGHLKQTVLLLSEEHELATLATALGLQKNLIQKWQRKAQEIKPLKPTKKPTFVKRKSPRDTVNFVTLPAPRSTQEASISLTLELHTGTRVLLCGQRREELLELTNYFLQRVGL